ncbi:hypothetical protein G7054_g15197 [Neopestalotiopsis clavispora]|nr:hypothetical protein G7054_g15197 [Neopestalotiopsis clavispora]
MLVSIVANRVSYKLDVMDTFEIIKIAPTYKVDGQEPDSYPANLDVLDRAESYYDLLEPAREHFEFIENSVGVKIRWVGTGPDREAMIKRAFATPFYPVALVTGREDAVGCHARHRGPVAWVAKEHDGAQLPRNVVPERPARPAHHLRALRVAGQHHLGVRAGLARGRDDGGHPLGALGRAPRREARDAGRRRGQGWAGEEAHVARLRCPAGIDDGDAGAAGALFQGLALDGGEEVARAVLGVRLAVARDPDVGGDVVHVDDTPEAVLVDLSGPEGHDEGREGCDARVDDGGQVEALAEDGTADIITSEMVSWCRGAMGRRDEQQEQQTDKED